VARLLYHAYTLAMIDLYVMLDHPLLADGSLQSRRAFEALLRGP